MKIKHIGICYSLLYLLPLIGAQQNIPQLLQEFSRVGTFRPQAPNEFNEQRAWEIIRTMEKISPTRAPQLELSLRRSLDVRSGTPAGAHAELLRLQQENQQLRDHARHLQEENGRLRSRPTAAGEDLEDCRAQLRACRERMAQFALLASRTITGLNEFERLMIAAGHELESATAWGFATPESREQRVVSARQFIDAGRTQIQRLGAVRTSIEGIFSTTP